MLLAFVMAVVLAVVFFKLGVYSVLLALFQLVGKVLFFGTGRFCWCTPGGGLCSGGGCRRCGGGADDGARSAGFTDAGGGGFRVEKGEYHRDGVSMPTAGLPLPAPPRVCRECGADRVMP